MAEVSELPGFIHPVGSRQVAIAQVSDFKYVLRCFPVFSGVFRSRPYTYAAACRSAATSAYGDG